MRHWLLSVIMLAICAEILSLRVLAGETVPVSAKDEYLVAPTEYEEDKASSSVEIPELPERDFSTTEKLLIGETETLTEAVIEQSMDGAEIVDSGYCGVDMDNIVWTLDGEGVLTINGTGAMMDYKVSPWQAYSTLGAVRIKTVVIGDDITNIGKNAFNSCSDLTKVTIGSDVTSIGDHAFQGTGLVNVTIPSSVKSIGINAFSCALTGVIFQDGVESIGYGAFANCSNLASITMGQGLTSIGDFAFCNCTSLARVNIPGDVTNIGAYAFYNCDGLTNVTIGNGTKNIGEHAFRDCISLKSVTLPNSLTYIDGWAFYNCINLKDVYFKGTEDQWNRMGMNSENDWLLNATRHYIKSGDIDGNDVVNILDVLHLLKYVAGQTVSMSYDGDTDGNGNVNILDVLHLLKYVAGQNVMLY